jgi:hypothetical protein
MAELSSKGVTDVKAEATMTVNGTLVTVQGKAITEIKGGMVNIN